MNIAEAQKIKVDGQTAVEAAVSALLSQEADAVCQYKALLASIADFNTPEADEVREQVAEILSDEENHIGRLVSLLSSLDPKAGEKIGAGIEGEE